MTHFQIAACGHRKRFPLTVSSGSQRHVQIMINHQLIRVPLDVSCVNTRFSPLQYFTHLICGVIILQYFAVPRVAVGVVAVPAPRVFDVLTVLACVSCQAPRDHLLLVVIISFSPPPSPRQVLTPPCHGTATDPLTGPPRAQGRQVGHSRAANACGRRHPGRLSPPTPRCRR